MKTKHCFVPVALLSSLTLATGLVFAADPEYPSNPEKSFTTQSPPEEKTAADVRAELDEFRHNPVSPDGWLDIGGEHGEVLGLPQYKFADGKFVRVDKVDYDAPSPSLHYTGEELILASLNYRNAP